MSSFVDLLPRTVDGVGEPETIDAELRGYGAERLEPWNASTFAKEQIRSLTRQVFGSQGARAVRQVVFSAVDPKVNIGPICAEIGLALSSQSSGTTCLVEASVSSPELKGFFERNDLDLVSDPESCTLHDSSLQFSSHLWFVPKPVFLEGEEQRWSVDRVKNRLTELRESFDYTVIYGPPAATCSEAVLLASLCDGMVLVVRANSTRRVTAQRVKEKLQSANARLLGVVLSDRTFPIPEAIYRRV